MKKKVLIIDDEPLIRRSLSRVLADENFQIETACDGVEGLAKWQEFDPDIVLLDIVMPRLTGLQVLEKIGKPKAKVVLMSAYSEAKHEDFSNSYVLFVSKPFEDIFKVRDIVTGIANG